MQALLKVAAVAVVGVLCAAVLRRGAPEFALLVLLAAGVWIFTALAGALESVVDMLSSLTRLARLDAAVVEPVVKTVGLSIVTRVTGEVCRAAGEGGMAAFVEVAGTVLALVAALPLVEAVLEMIVGML